MQAQKSQSTIQARPLNETVLASQIRQPVFFEESQGEFVQGQDCTSRSLLLSSPVDPRARIDTKRSQKKGVMAMIDLSRVLNQSPSSNCPKTSPGWGMRRLLIGFAAVLLLICPMMSKAQELSATLSGIVSDSTGAVIPNAAVTITLNGVGGAARDGGRRLRPSVP